LPISHGWIAALLTGTDEHDDKAQEVLADNREGKAFQLGYAANPSLAALQERLDGRLADGSNAPDGPASANVKQAAEQTIARKALSILPLGVPPDLYSGLDITDSGSVELIPEPGDDGYGDWYATKVRQFLFNDIALTESATAGANAIATIADTTVAEGGVAKLKLHSRNDGAEAAGGPGTPGWCPGNVCRLPLPGEESGPTIAPGSAIYPTVELPVNTNIAAGRAGIQTLADVNTNRADTVIDDRLAPGGTQKRLQVSPEHGTAQGTVAGATDGTDVDSDTAGRVLHSRSDQGSQPSTVLNELRAAPERSADLAYPQLEFLITTALDPDHVGSSGCGCSLGGAANGFGSAIIAKLNSF